MKKKLLFLFLALLGLLLPQQSYADSGAWYFKEPDGFKWMVCGDGEIEFSIPVMIWDSSGNDIVVSGYIIVTPEGEAETSILNYGYDESRDMNKPAWFEALADGTFSVTNTVSGMYSFTRNDGKKYWVLKVDSDDDDHHTAKIRWKVPYQWRGKKIQMRVSFVWKDWGSPQTIGHQLETYDCPAASAASITLSEPMLAFDKSSAGKITIPWYAQLKSLKDAKLRLVDAISGKVSYINVETNGLAGYVNIPMNRPYSSVQLGGSAVTTDGLSIPGEFSSNSIEVPMLHTPSNLTANMLPDGKVVLKWFIDHANFSDIVENDLFEIQRNVTGSTSPDDSNWTSIGSVSYQDRQSYYECVDSEMVDRYVGKPVSYRIRRQATSLWGWVSAAEYAQTEIPANLNIYGINNATATRNSEWNDDVHKVDFAFNFGGPESDESGRLIIRNRSDWVSFAKRVNAGETKLNAIMAGDIDINDSQVMVGTETNPYQGQFDGNGYTLIVHYAGTEEFIAPFRYVKDAQITNLILGGDIVNTRKYTGGLIAHVLGGTVKISKSSVSASIKSDYAPGNDGACVGGFVSRVANGSDVTFEDCRFNGQLLGDSCHANGGFVGYADSKVKFVRCLFEPTKIATKLDECRTFARGVVPEITGCYFTEYYDNRSTTTIDGKEFFIIRNTDGWNQFVKMVGDAKGGQDVNAILTADLDNVTNSVGYSESPYNGIFEGNGHTININIYDGGIRLSGLFREVNNATIRNLHVTGSVAGGTHVAGLVSFMKPSGSITLDKIHVSTNITARYDSNFTGTIAGGLIGHAETAKVVITNCLFDGSMNSEAYNHSYAGAIVGWANGDSDWKIDKCYENGKYSNFQNISFTHVYVSSSATVASWFGGSFDNLSSNRMSDCLYDLTDYSASNVAEKLGAQWAVINGIAVPVMDVSQAGLGTDATLSTKEELLAKMGSNWQIKGNAVVPAITSETGKLYGSTLWDKRAKLQLRINMHGENGVESSLVDLTGNTDVISKNQYTQELSRKCVEYSFDFIVSRNNSTLPIINTQKDTAVYAVKKIDQGDLANYRFMNGNRITKLVPKQKQSSVELSWETSGGEYDYFRVLRRKHVDDSQAATAPWTDTVAVNLNQLYYEDKNVLVQQAYDYRVESVWQCEGTNLDGMTCSAECSPTGMIDGYIRMSDGTAMAGATVNCKPVGTIPGADSQYTTTSDSTGYFVFRGLPIHIDSLGNSSQYEVWVSVAGDGGSYVGPNGTSKGTASFGRSSNWSTDFNFYMNSYFIYSGYVYYRDTSVPVPGVSFKLDGELMHNASKKLITTDSQGAFSLSIPKGAHSVQAVKDGHFFAQDGFLMNPDAPKGKETSYNFEKDVNGIFLWDSTTVVLQGRVIGGDVQGSKPFGQGLSVNNLGDSIKIVMQLEGDNASYLIRKQDDTSIKSASYDYSFGINNENKTRVDVTRHTMTIYPDPETGEYQMKLHPAKYKVIEISAQGYATLFQQGKVGETLDLSLNVKGDTCEFNRIYHAVPTVQVKQFNPSGEDYFGVKQLTAADNIGNKATVRTWYTKTVKKGENEEIVIPYYSFGYPVFMGGTSYGWMLQACEMYYKNNDYNSTPDIVKLNGGKVNIKNALTTDSKTAEWTGTLDEEGYASYIFVPNNPTFAMTDDNALKTVSITLEYDNSFYDIKPFNGEILKGFVMATTPKKEGRKAVVAGIPHLFDILRDPPGGSSSAYIEEGSKLSYGYTWDLAASLGLSVKSSTGTGVDSYKGEIFAPSGIGANAGMISNTTTIKGFDINISTNFGMSWAYNYNMDVTERIQTSSSKKWIGGKADTFIGVTENIVVEDAIAVRVIPDSMYQIVKLNEGGTFEMTDNNGNKAKIKVPQGALKVLAKGIDDTGNPVYLVRDEVMQLYPKLKSTFVHTQQFIENELLTDLMKIRNSLLLPMGTDSAYAKSLANKQGYASYVSHVAVDDSQFGLPGNYTIYYPDGKNYGDSISSLNQEMYAWISMLAKNEEEKIAINPANLVKRYDFDGGSTIQYSETFTTSANGSRYCRYPLLSGFGNVLNMGGFIPPLVNAIEKGLTKKGSSISTSPLYKFDDEENISSIEIVAFGQKTKLQFMPIITANFNDKFTYSESNSKKTGFTLSASSKSSLTVDVYRTQTQMTYDKNQNVFYELTEETLNTVLKGKLGDTSGLSFLDYDTPVFSNFVFRTRAGVTCEPYEDARVTKWFQPGTVIDVATIPVDKPRIWIDEPVKSNVPFDEPARFTLHFSNESDYPERASLVFNYYLDPTSNPDGAKVLIDGTPINSQGVNIVLYPCRDKNNEVVVFTKEIEVWPGKEFDYNNLTLSVYDPEDAKRVFSAKFSAHFVPTAGKVNISSPSSNWVINTESPYDGVRQSRYMPVRIDGFDTNYRGFDHIELQYKLSTQGENDWVNVCSYYSDESLREKASGVTDTIPANGVIVAKFYGEADPVEQYYDIRAVNYCRHSGGYLTGYSEVLKGIKDTQRPTSFGTAEPINGILGIGDDIKFKFSEPIAANYLRPINNFEVLGTLNSNSISTSTSLSFVDNSIAFAQSDRNLSGKSFTVDVMLNPDTVKQAMPVFVHGSLEFGLSADRKLTATINGQTAESDSVVAFNNSLHSVGYSLDQSGEGMTVSFFDGSNAIGTKKLTGKYEGTTSILLGYNVGTNYKGEMLELRLWNRVLSAADFANYANKRLTGYESGLLDYYPLNEGEGMWAYDHAAGSMDLMLSGTSWKRPSGISLKFSGDKGLLLNNRLFTRDKNNDFTLMFWFRTSDDNSTFLSNGEAKYGQDNQINIGIKNKNLYVRSSGFEKNNLSLVSDGSWHHYAMTVSRSQNVSNVYLDKSLVASFAADSISGISTDIFALGATYADKNTPSNVMTGNIDEIGMFSSVLPVNLIKEYSNHTPINTMSSMMAYLDFGRSEKMDNNQQRLEPTGISIKRYLDDRGEVRPVRDTLIAADIVAAMADRNTYAPMVSNAQLDNLNYNYVANNNELYIEINQPDFMVEKTNIYVTLMDVADLQGNVMSSPITRNFYVYRSPLRWDVKQISKDLYYGKGLVFEATIKNLSGTTQNYELQDIPVWITPSTTSGTIDALGEVVIQFTVSPYINIGTYTEQLTLISENNMTEPLPIVLKVRGDEPEWSVSNDLKKQNIMMQMVAQVKIKGVVATSTEDILGVFDQNDRVLGVSHIEVANQANANQALAYVTIFGDDAVVKNPALRFKYFQANSGNIYPLEAEDETTYNFKEGETLGSANAPIVLAGAYDRVQVLQLKAGWNWISFNVTPEAKITVGKLLNGAAAWEPGDVIEGVVDNKPVSLLCESASTPQGYRWTNENDEFKFDENTMYRIYSVSDKMVYIGGSIAGYSVNLHKGWNRIAYLSTINLPIENAMNDYMHQASEGDVLKSQDAFAIISHDYSGNLIWKGSLTHMETGQGYMLKRNADSNASFYYPEYWGSSRYSGGKSSIRKNRTATTMNIVAKAAGIELEQGDKLVVYSGAERYSEAAVDDEQLFYLNIGENAKDVPMMFCIERDDEVVAASGSTITYQADKMIGTPEKPNVINFLPIEQMNDGSWYTVSGIKLSKKPATKGYYINNGKIKLVK